MMTNRSKLSKRIWITFLFPVLALACGSYLPIEQLAPSAEESKPATKAPTPTVLLLPALTTDEQEALIKVYNRANPAVVNVTQYGQQGGEVVPVGQGSGFVYDSEGHIVTNAHVVHGSDQIEVTFADATVRIAELVGEDLNSDLAVVKIKSLPDGVVPLTLGDMGTLSVGQTVIAIGNPFGLEGTLTKGVISALGRTIPALTPFSIPQAIQTDAAINPGNSGGPLLNLQAEVIGVNAQIETGGTSRTNSGVGFAIPVSIIKLVVPDLIDKGVHEWAWLGVSGGNLFPTLIEAMDLPVEKGAYIAEVVSNGPSDKAGLRGASGTQRLEGRVVQVGGDVVTTIDGQEIRSFDDLLIYIALQTSPDQTVNVTIIRNGKEQSLEITLERRPESFTE
jgi:2-alkenal reductase